MIVGIIGGLGAGKGTVAEHLVKHHGFMYLSVRNYLAGEVVRGGQQVNVETVRQKAAELRAAHGPAYVVEQLLSQPHDGHPLVVESIRLPEEVALLKAEGAVVWNVQTDLPLRYDRTVAREATKHVLSLEDFTKQEAAEEAVLSVIYPSADRTLTNNGTKDELFAELEEAFKSVDKPVSN